MVDNNTKPCINRSHQAAVSSPMTEESPRQRLPDIRRSVGASGLIDKGSRSEQQILCLLQNTEKLGICIKFSMPTKPYASDPSTGWNGRTPSSRTQACAMRCELNCADYMNGKVCHYELLLPICTFPAPPRRESDSQIVMLARLLHPERIGR